MTISVLTRSVSGTIEAPRMKVELELPPNHSDWKIAALVSALTAKVSVEVLLALSMLFTELEKCRHVDNESGTRVPLSQSDSGQGANVDAPTT
jgi:hypothetical protein